MPARVLGDLGPSDARALLAIENVPPEARAQLERLIETNACVHISQLAVNGRDMTAMGLAGRDVGEALRRLLDEVMGGATPNERTALLRRIRTLL